MALKVRGMQPEISCHPLPVVLTVRAVQDHCLAALKLGGRSWVPSSMEASPAHPDALSNNTSLLPDSLRQAGTQEGAGEANIDPGSMTRTEMAEWSQQFAGAVLPHAHVHARLIPQALRFEFRNLHPFIALPNAILGRTVGYDMHVRSLSCSPCRFS